MGAERFGLRIKLPPTYYTMYRRSKGLCDNDMSLEVEHYATRSVLWKGFWINTGHAQYCSFIIVWFWSYFSFIIGPKQLQIQPERSKHFKMDYQELQRTC